MRVSYSKLLLAIIVTTPSVACAADWPQLRGPERNGVSPETGLKDKWETPPKLLWKTENLGVGYAGVVTKGDLVCMIGDHDGRTNLFGLGAKDGKVRWTVSLGKAYSKESYPGPRCTPTIDGNYLYVLTPYGVVVCMELDSQKLVWVKGLFQEFQGQSPGWGYAESPLVDGDRLICTPGGPKAGLVAFDKKTGKEIWRTELSFPTPQQTWAGYSSVMVSNAGGVRQYVQLMDRGLVGVDAETGKLLWNYDGDTTNSGSNMLTALVHGDYLWVANDGSSLLKITKTDDGFGVNEVHHIDDVQNFPDAVVHVGNYIYANYDVPTCVEFMTGKVVWQATEQKAGGQAGLTYADGNLYLRYSNGDVALVGADPTKYELKGNFKIETKIQDGWIQPVIHDGRLYVRDAGTLYCYDIKK